MRFTTVKTKKHKLTKREVSMAHFIPYKCHWNSSTIITHDEKLIRIIKVKGFSFETADDIDIELIELSEPPLLWTIPTPYLLQLIALEGKDERVGMLCDVASEGNRKVKVEAKLRLIALFSLEALNSEYLFIDNAL